MRRRAVLISLVAAAGMQRSTASMAQEDKPATVGVLVVHAEWYTGFQEALRRLGHVEGRNLRFEMRSADNDIGALPELARDLVRAEPDVIVAWPTPAVLAVQQATHSIPIVMIGPPDPVGSGFIASFAHPGGNITGLANMGDTLTEKSAELLREAAPGATRMAALANAPDPYSKLFLAYSRTAGQALGIEMLPVPVSAGPELDAAFAMMIDRGVGGALVQPSLPQKRVADLAISHRLPSAGGSPYARVGGLVGYSAKVSDVVSGAAALVDKILKGAKPADLPVEQPTKFELVINLKTAKALGLSVPSSLLARADEVIE